MIYVRIYGWRNHASISNLTYFTHSFLRVFILMQWHFWLPIFSRCGLIILLFHFYLSFFRKCGHILFYAFLNDDFFAIRSDCRRTVRPPCHSLRLSMSPHPLSSLARIRL